MGVSVNYQAHADETDAQLNITEEEKGLSFVLQIDATIMNLN